jgi:hypothetical protein
MADAVQDTYATVRESDEPSEASFKKKNSKIPTNQMD